MSFNEQGNTAELCDNNTVEQEISSADPGKSRTEIRSICGNMMFPGDNALKKIAVLSGGERSRVLLAKTLLFTSNLLILDEPTHHLDIESCSALLEAVQVYEGAAVIVTHDEYFLHKAATKLIIFTENGIKFFPGNYSEFLERMGWEHSKPVKKIKAAGEGKQNRTVCDKNSLNKKEKRRQRAAKRSLLKKRLGGFESRIAKLEKDIHNKETQRKTLTDELIESSKNKNPKNIADISKKLKCSEKNIDRLYHELDAELEAYEIAKKEFRE